MMKIGMRIEVGINLRSKETTRLEPIITNDAAAPIPKPSLAVIEVAKVGQRPIIRIKVGFSKMMPRVK